mmetsp:Transcript_60579/g.173738  ORF Transcript_60579/g.173738 Transcript_60579/m.173738 type:complete len:231 (+) Transcript_60579:100-792(+)
MTTPPNQAMSERAQKRCLPKRVLAAPARSKRRAARSFQQSRTPSSKEICDGYAIPPKLFQRALEVVRVGVAMTCHTTACARLDVDIEGWSVRVVRHRPAQPKHDAPSERDLEQLQQDDALRVVGQVALRLSPLVAVAIAIDTWRERKLDEDGLLGVGMPGQSVAFQRPLQSAVVGLRAEHLPEVLVASWAALALQEPLLQALLVKSVPTLQFEHVSGAAAARTVVIEFHG